MNSGVVVQLSNNRVGVLRNFFCKCVRFDVCLAVVCGVFLCLCSEARGQLVSSRKVDYGVAVEGLVKLGFADVKGARYVHLKSEQLEYESNGFRYSSNKAPKFKGNGFYVAGKDGGKGGRFISITGMEYSYTKIQGRSADGGMSGYYGDMSSAQRTIGGVMKDVDLGADLLALKQWALEQAAGDSFSYNSSSIYQPAFVFANLAYQAGGKEGANEVIKTLFLNADDAEQILDKVVGVIARNEYARVFSQFNKSHDWAKYLSELERLQKSFPRGWNNQSGLSILIPLVKKRVNKVAVPEPVIAGHAFSDEIALILKQTAVSEKGSGNGYYGANLFLINKVPKDSKAGAIHKLTHYGMDGFIALVSLLGDDTLVLGGAGGSGYGGHHTYYGSGDGESAEYAYRSMQRPKTRGELASALVKSNLPHSNEDISELNDDELKALAVEWWREHRNDDKVTLIKHYLSKGNRRHVSSLLNAIMLEGDDASFALFEKTILESSHPGNWSNMVKAYVLKRKARGKEFLLKYQDVLLASIGEAKDRQNTDGNYEIVQAGGTRKFISGLLLYTEAQDPDKLYEKLAKDGADVSSIMGMLTHIYKGEKLRGQVSKIVHIAASTDDSKKQGEILQILYQGQFMGEQMPRRQGGIMGVMKSIFSGGGKVSAKVTFSDEEKGDWKKLLASEGKIDYQDISLLAGMILDKYVNPSLRDHDYRGIMSLGADTVNELISARSESILAGEKVDPLPSVSLVKSDRLKEVSDQLAKVSAIDFRKMYSALNYSERLYVLNNIASREKFKEAAVYVQGVVQEKAKGKVGEESVAEYEKLLGGLIGKKVEVGTYVGLTKTMIAQLVAFEGMAVSVAPNAVMPGMDFYLRRANGVYDKEGKEAIADLVAGKRGSFVVMSVASNRYGGSDTKVFIFDESSMPDEEKLGEIQASSKVEVIAVTKKVVEEWKKNPVRGKEDVINEIMKLTPEIIHMRTDFERMNLEQLEDALKQMKGMNNF